MLSDVLNILISALAYA